MPPVDPTSHTRADQPLLPTLRRFLPYLWPAGAAGAEGADRRLAAARASCRKLVQVLAPPMRVAVNRMTRAATAASRRSRSLLVVGYAGARFGGVAVRQSAQRDVRAGRPGCDAAAGRERLPPSPRAVAALPSRAAHRRGHQDRRARHQEHRHDALFPAVQHRADGARAGAGAACIFWRQVRARPGRGDAGDGRRSTSASPAWSPTGAPRCARR